MKFKKREVMSIFLIASIFMSTPIVSMLSNADVIKEKSITSQNSDSEFTQKIEKNNFIKKEGKLINTVKRRLEPKDESKYKDTEKEGVEVLIIGEDGDYFKVARNQFEFFVKKEFVKVEKSNFKIIEHKESEEKALNKKSESKDNNSNVRVSLANSGSSVKEAEAYQESSVEITSNSANSLTSSISTTSGDEIMSFKNAVVTGFNDSHFSIGPAQGKNAVAAHNMPFGTVVEIPQLKGKMGGGTFKSTRSGKTYDLGPVNNGRFIVADNGGPFFDFDIYGYTGGKGNLDVNIVSWGSGEGMTWSITEAINDAKNRGTWSRLQKAFNNTNTTYGGFKTKALSKFKDHDINNSLIK